MNISLLKEIVEQDKPVSTTALKEYCRYLLQQLDEKDKVLRHEMDKAFERADYSLAYILEYIVNHTGGIKR